MRRSIDCGFVLNKDYLPTIETYISEVKEALRKK